MAEGKTNNELILDKQLKILMAEERAAKQTARNITAADMKFSLKKDDLVNGIILREVLGPPKALEGK